MEGDLVVSIVAHRAMKQSCRGVCATNARLTHVIDGMTD